MCRRPTTEKGNSRSEKERKKVFILLRGEKERQEKREENPFLTRLPLLSRKYRRERRNQFSSLWRKICPGRPGLKKKSPSTFILLDQGELSLLANPCVSDIRRLFVYVIREEGVQECKRGRIGYTPAR